MTYEIGGGIDMSFPAGEDMSGMQFRFVHLETDETIEMLDSAGEHSVGILQNAPESGEIAVVRVSGVSKLVCGAGGLAIGDAVAPEYIGASDNGKGIANTTNAIKCRARCLQAGGSEDDLAAVVLADFIYTAVTS